MSNAILGSCFDHVATRATEAGLPVVEHEGWRTRTMPASAANGGRYTPVGVIDHHTARPVPFPLDRLTTKCNISIRAPDGAVCLLNAGWAFDSGNGDRIVLDAVKRDAPLPRPTDTYVSRNDTLVPAPPNPGITGNPWFIDIEVQHLGDGSALLDVMERALIVTNAAICEFMGWNPLTRVIGHREWTRRKTDPKWNGSENPMPGLRSETFSELGRTAGTGHPGTFNADEEEEGMWQYLTVDEDLVRHAWKQGWLQPKTQETLDFFLEALRNGTINDPTFGNFQNFRVAVTNGIARGAGRVD
jgi:hypothetical protein